MQLAMSVLIRHIFRSLYMFYVFMSACSSMHGALTLRFDKNVIVYTPIQVTMVASLSIICTCLASNANAINMYIIYSHALPIMYTSRLKCVSPYQGKHGAMSRTPVAHVAHEQLFSVAPGWQLPF
jgi:hypothetical protein